MQTAKNAAESLKETAANVTASAKSGMDKTKATAQEKGEKMMSTGDPMAKEMARRKKEEKINQAEFEKQQAMQQNAAAKGARSSGMSAMDGHGIDHPSGPVMGGTIPSHPAGMNTETTGTTTAGHNSVLGGTRDVNSIP